MSFHARMSGRRPLPARVLLGVGLGLVWLWHVPESARPVAAGSAAQRGAKEAIRKVLDRQAADWNKGDLEGFMAGYWKSPDLTFFSGNKPERGWQATLDRYRKRYQGEGREMGKLTFDDIRIDLLGPDAALVRGRWQLTRKKDNPGGLFTLIFRRLPEGWRIIHDHTSAGTP